MFYAGVAITILMTGWLVLVAYPRLLAKHDLWTATLLLLLGFVGLGLAWLRGYWVSRWLHERSQKRVCEKQAAAHPQGGRRR